MKLVRIAAWLLGLTVLAAPLSFLSAEEITLKDGTKITGTIVGYEKDMFRVETDYGVALIRKDKVVSIQLGKPASATSAASPPVPVAATKSTESKAPTTPQFPAPAAPAPKPANTIATPAAAMKPTPQVTPPAPPSQSTPAPVIKPPEPLFTPKPAEPAPVAAKPVPPPAPPPAPPPVSHPIDTPLPAHLEEHLDENTYFSDTFHFSMFKPPDWKIFTGVPKETGSGIMAMGTDDEQTVLIVDRQMWSGTPRLSSDEVEAKFRQTYQDYRRLSEQSFQRDGQPATRRTFTGVLDGVEWHGVAIHVIHGDAVYGVTGVTSAETFGFQEAIFNKIAKSFHFTSIVSSGGASRP